MPGTQRVKEVKTRKPHVCDSCKKTIPTGSIAENASGIAITEDGVIPYSYYYCQKCMEEAYEQSMEDTRDMWDDPSYY